MMKPPWNSLEIAKLVMELLTPATIALLGIYVHHVSKRYEETQWKSQKLIEKRLVIYPWGGDPKLRTWYGRRREAAGVKWLPADEARFSTDAGQTPPEKIQQAYAQVMREFTSAFGMPCPEETLATASLPADIH